MLATKLHALVCLHSVGILNRPDLFRLRMGNNKAIGTGPYQQIVTAEKLFMHPGYDYGKIATDPGDDLALLKLKEPFEITDHVRTVCLPTASMAEDFPSETPVTVTGWGRDSNKDPSKHNFLF